ncbi:thioredoxin family protein [Youngiibacter multivorans]|uniref:Small redox-active disulfide protein 2 n=1 Tax=Youngiibacter multivorans TaxID=937251 RepID=A0ABS4G0A4_9CLOT|nr:thioredoxin family protein [Youngiibacter multivorans]MBP1917927.1 small redox-active disulfide protein 2 [Youngiibacter multivorans]
MILKILGTGCSNCKKLEANVREAVKDMGLDAEVLKVENIKDIMSYGVMGTPALVKDEKVLFAGRVPNLDAIKKYIAE